MKVQALNPLRSAELYWDKAAETYEKRFSGTTVGKIRRESVWRDLERVFSPGQRVLEISCGTGIDAVFLARRGVQVLGCDISPRMIEMARDLAARDTLLHPPDFRILATEHLSTLAPEAPFEGAFSNFSGLNCVEDLSQVARTLSQLLKPQGRLLICMMGRFVPLEILWFLAHGNLQRAFIRLREPRTDCTATKGIIIRRHSVAQIKQQMKPAFRLVGWKGIGIVVPPSYAEDFANRHTDLIRLLAKIDRQIGTLPVIRGMADCVLLEFEKV